MTLQEAIDRKTARIGIIGMGYVGLPLAREFSRAGFQVLGFDVDARKIERLAKGESYIKHIPSETIAAMRQAGFQATSELGRLNEPDAIIICVPTPLTPQREPDLSYIVNTTRAIRDRLRKGQLVVLESTTYPGTTREVMLPELASTGLKVEEDFFLAFSPEREDPGNPSFATHSIPKVVGGIGPRSAQLAQRLYAHVVVRVVPVSDASTAEAVKIVENIYRSVNIALVNELKVTFAAMGLDIWEIIAAAATKPFGYQPFYPGPGLGGHCIPIDPFYLTWKAREFGLSTRFIELAGEINTSMPRYVIDRLIQALNDHKKPLRGSRVLLLGMAYKADVDDIRESPSLALVELLRQGGAEVCYHDPHIPEAREGREYAIHLKSQPLTAELLRSLDAVLIATAHKDVDYELVVREAPLIIDTRNATRDVEQGREKIVKA